MGIKKRRRIILSIMEGQNTLTLMYANALSYIGLFFVIYFCPVVYQKF